MGRGTGTRAAVSASSHNTQEFICNGNYDVCYGGRQTGQQVDTSIPVSPRRRSVTNLFRLAASKFQYVSGDRMSYSPLLSLEKRALQTAQDYAKAVANHALPAHIVAAAKQAGWIPPAHLKRGLLDERAVKPGAGGATTGSKSVLPSQKVTVHVAKGGEIPSEVVQAALATGWRRPGSTQPEVNRLAKAAQAGSWNVLYKSCQAQNEQTR